MPVTPAGPLLGVTDKFVVTMLAGPPQPPPPPPVLLLLLLQEIKAAAEAIDTAAMTNPTLKFLIKASVLYHPCESG
jgi:hypothetical protein